VSTFTLPAGKAQLVPYTRPPVGVVVVRARANAPVRLYVLDSKQRDEYLKGGAAGDRPNFQVLGTAVGEAVQFTATVPAEWFLVVENPSAERDVSGEYAVTAMVPTSVPSGSAGPMYGDPSIAYGDPRLPYGGSRR
jgi:hypothetical protein